MPVVGVGLLDLALVFGFIVCLSMQQAWRKTLGVLLIDLANLLDKASVNVGVRRIHLFGPLTSALRGLEKSVDHALGAAAIFCEHKATALFQLLRTLLVQLVDELRDLARSTEHALGLAPTITLGQIRKQIAAAEAYAARRLKTVEAQLHGEADRLFGKARHGIDVLTKRLDVTIPKRIARAEARVGALEHEIHGLRGRAGRIEALLGIGAITTLVGTALARMGLRWLRCGNVRKAGESVCKMDSNLLESLLVDAAALTVAFDLVTFAKEVQAITGTVADEIHRFAA